MSALSVLPYIDGASARDSAPGKHGQIPGSPMDVGAYGTRAAHRSLQGQLTRGEAHEKGEATVRYTPADTVSAEDKQDMVLNAFGYAGTLIDHFDTNNNQQLDRDEIVRTYLGCEEATDRYIAAMDLPAADGSRDGAVGVLEMAVSTVLCDNATTWLTQKLRERTEDSEWVDQADTFEEKYPSTLDGQMTYQERLVDSAFMHKVPFGVYNAAMVALANNPEFPFHEAYRQFQLARAARRLF